MNDKKIWEFLMDKIQNPYGVAALMGNLYVESKLNPKDLQGSYERKLGMSDDEYTDLVDKGSYTRDMFINDQAGYGLAQWTYWSRKEALYDYAKTEDTSIGNLDMQLMFLWKELQSYKTVLTTLKTASDVREASDIVVKRYEKPKNQTEPYLANRAKYGQEFYNKYANEKKTKYVIATANVNIRAGNSTDYKKVGQLPKGQKLEWVATAENGWHAVKNDANVYWISGDFSALSE